MSEVRLGLLKSIYLQMLDIKHTRYLILDDHNISKNVPPEPGIFILAAKTSNNTLQEYFIGHSNNLRQSLKNIKKGIPTDLPPVAQSLLNKYIAFFKFIIVPLPEYLPEIKKMLMNTNDPVTNLTLHESF